MRVSVVVPACNEEENVAHVHRELTASLSRGAFGDHEIIFVDDASTDATAAQVLALNDPRVRLVRLPKRSGRSIAQGEGFRSARFEVIATIDATRREDPADLNPMAELLAQGWDFVQGRRARRPALWLVNAGRRLVLGGGPSDMGCGFRLFRRQCVESVRLFNGAHALLPYLVEKKGYRVTEIGIRHRPRAGGGANRGSSEPLFAPLLGLLRARFSA